MGSKTICKICGKSVRLDESTYTDVAKGFGRLHLACVVDLDEEDMS